MTSKKKAKKGRPIFDRTAAKKASLLYGSPIREDAIELPNNSFTASLGVDPAAIFCLAGMISRYETP